MGGLEDRVGDKPQKTGAPTAGRLALSDRTATWVVIGLILAGAALRLLWTLNGHLAPINSEAFFIARALAEGRGFAEAFGLGTGPTAHLMPTTPLPAALVYTLMGVGSPAAELTLTLWAVGCVGGSIFAGERVMRELGVGAWARIGGVAAASLTPIQLGLESSAFRVWEGALAALLLLTTLLICLRLDKRDEIGWKPLLGLGALNGLVFLVSPAAAIATSGVIGLLFLRRVHPFRWPAPVLVAIAIVAAVLVPWGLRNEAVLGKFVPLRTGSGISMALAYHEGRVRTDDIQADDLKRFREVSPLMGEAARRHYLDVGEVEFNRELNLEARAWREAHPEDVWKIRARNLVEFYAPPAWLWTRFTSDRGSGVEMRRLLVAASALAGFLTLVAVLAARQWRWLYVTAALVLPSLPYIAVYPLLRYRYLVSTLLILVAAYGAVTLITWARDRIRPGVARST